MADIEELMRKYTMPKVHPGETVYYKMSRTQKDWHPLFVTFAGTHEINGIPFNPGRHISHPDFYSQGVLHVSDPRLTDPEFVHRYFGPDMDPEFKGVWDYSPAQKAAMELAERVTALEAVLGIAAEEAKEDGEPKRRPGRPRKEEQPAG